MDRINRGIFYKKNIRRSPPSSCGSCCSVRSHNSVSSIKNMVVEEQKVPLPSGNEIDIDIEIEHEVAETLSCRSQCQGLEMSESHSFAPRIKDLTRMEKNMAKYIQLTSGIPVRRVEEVLDFMSYEKQPEQQFRPTSPGLIYDFLDCSDSNTELTHISKGNNDKRSKSPQK